jgi:hypothetical protein
MMRVQRCAAPRTVTETGFAVCCLLRCVVAHSTGTVQCFSLRSNTTRDAGAVQRRVLHDTVQHGIVLYGHS